MWHSVLTLHRLKLFTAVYEQGSLNRAAQQFMLSQSAVSQHIQALENGLGVRLFDRSSRGVMPTAAGERLYQYALEIQTLVAKAEAAVMQVNQLKDERLLVASTAGLSVYMLPIWLRRFQDIYPNISLSVETGLTKDVLHIVQEGRADFGFFVGELNFADQADLIELWLKDIPYWVVVNPAHAWAKLSSVSLQTLSKSPFLCRPPTSRSRRWLDVTMRAHQVDLNVAAELDTPGAIKYALLSDLGASILPSYAVEREVLRGDLVHVPMTEIELSRPLKIVLDGRRPISPIQRAFLHQLSPDMPAVHKLL